MTYQPETTQAPDGWEVWQQWDHGVRFAGCVDRCSVVLRQVESYVTAEGIGPDLAAALRHAIEKANNHVAT